MRPDRELGQNFLVDSNLLGVIGRLAELDAGDVVLEVGGGLGVLSEYLAPRVAHLHVVEIDPRLGDALNDALDPFDNVTLHLADAMRLDLGALAPAPTKVVANLPYGIAATLLLRTISELEGVTLWVAMVQREVGERLAARPGGREYGIPSVLAQLSCEVEVARSVSRNVFRPVPNVDSALVVLRRRGPVPAPRCERWSRPPSPTAARRSPRRWRWRRGRVATPVPAPVKRSSVWALPRTFVPSASRRRSSGRWGASSRPGPPPGPTRSRNRPTRSRNRPTRSRNRPTRSRNEGVGMRPLAARAPAKVNLCLFLGGTRADGRHELVSVMQSVSLADEVRLLPARPGAVGDEVVCPGVEGLNLAGAALAAFRARTGWDAPPLRIEIDKRIPVAAGMAGGSADAAAVLRLAAHAFGEADPVMLLELAAGLGSDVPGQLRPGRVLATGAGERVERLADAPGFGVLVIPFDAALSTPKVFAEADRLGLARSEAELAGLLEDVRAGQSAAAEPPRPCGTAGPRRAASPRADGQRPRARRR